MHFYAPANDGSTLLGAPVVVPHYAAMIASIRPQEAVETWAWLISEEFSTPLTNVESLAFLSSSSCDAATLGWSQLKGSWNLSLQTLGWGRYLAQRDAKIPILWRATTANPLLRKGYLLLVPVGPLPTPTLTSEAGIDSGRNGIWISKVLAGESTNTLAVDPATPVTLYTGTGGGAFKVN